MPVKTFFHHSRSGVFSQKLATIERERPAVFVSFMTCVTTSLKATFTLVPDSLIVVLINVFDNGFSTSLITEQPAP